MSKTNYKYFRNCLSIRLVRGALFFSVLICSIYEGNSPISNLRITQTEWVGQEEQTDAEITIRLEDLLDRLGSTTPLIHFTASLHALLAYGGHSYRVQFKAQNKSFLFFRPLVFFPGTTKFKPFNKEDIFAPFKG